MKEKQESIQVFQELCGKTDKGYTYEMLRCDDALALTIGTLTDCCQEICGVGQSSMEHSVVSPDGRVFCVRDSEGRLVAQSWFWRNQYTGCFDNIEIPKKIFELYEKGDTHGRVNIANDVLEVYKKAAIELMKEDEKVYNELLEKGTITKEQYDALLLGKITIGLGYNDIAEAIRDDKTISLDRDVVHVKGTERLSNPYSDAATQYIVAKRDGIVKSQEENLYVHQDEIPIYDKSNMTSTVLLTMKRMGKATNRQNLSYLSEQIDEENMPNSQKIMNKIAWEYALNRDTTKVLATSRMAIIYSEKDGKIEIGDLLLAPIKEDITEEQKQKAQNHIRYQIKKALNQIGITGLKVNMSLLNNEQRSIISSIIQEIENDGIEK